MLDKDSENLKKLQNKSSQGLNKPPMQNNNPNNKMPNNQPNPLVKEGAKMAANAAFGPLGGAAVEAASKTDMGKKMLNNASALSGKNPALGAKNPLNGLTKNHSIGQGLLTGAALGSKSKEQKTEGNTEANSSDEGGTNETEQEVELSASGEIEKQVKKAAPFLGGCGVLFFALVVLITIIISITTSPIFAINNFISGIANRVSSGFGQFIENMSNLAECGYKPDEECNEIKETKFYEALKKVNSDYQIKYKVKLNVSLLTATLTWYDLEGDVDNNLDGDFEIDEGKLDEIIDEDGNITGGSDYVDFKKSKKHIKELAEQMVSDPIKVDSEGKPLEKKDWIYRLDLEKYKKYLEDVFIRKYYFNGKNDAETDLKVKTAIKEIYDRVEFYDYVMDSSNGGTVIGSACNFNATKIKLVSCDNNVTIAENVSLKDYILGVVLAEIDVGYLDSPEYYKAFMVAAKTFALARNNYNSTDKNITIRSCQADQEWCDINTGCYRVKENADSSWETVYPIGFDLPVVAQPNGPRKQPLSAEKKELLEGIYDEIANYLFLSNSKSGIIDNLGGEGDLVSYYDKVVNKWLEYAENGVSFEQILKNTGTSSDFTATIQGYYKDKSIYDLAKYCKATGYSGSGDYKVDFAGDGSINVGNPIEFFTQNTPDKPNINGTTINNSGKKITRSDSYDLYGCSCGPTTFTMIVNAMGNIGYLTDYFANTSVSGSEDQKAITVAMMHRYLADHGIQGYPNDGRCGGLNYASVGHNSTIYNPLGIEFIEYKAQGSFDSKTIYDHLAAGRLIMYNIQSGSCPSRSTVCEGFGATSGGHFGIIYGYDNSDQKFIVYNPLKNDFIPLKASSAAVSRLNSITVFGGYK